MIRGRPDLAVPRLREVVEMLRDSASARSALGDALAAIADALHDLGQPDEARDLAEEASRCCGQRRSPWHWRKRSCGRAR